MLAGEANTSQVFVEHIRRDVLCEDVCRIVVCSDRVDCENAVVYELLYNIEVFEVNVFRFLAASDSCCDALSTC